MVFFLQPTLSSITAGKQSLGIPVSASSRWTNVRACPPTLLLPCFGSHKTKSLTSFWLLQYGPVVMIITEREVTSQLLTCWQDQCGRWQWGCWHQSWQQKTLHLTDCQVCVLPAPELCQPCTAIQKNTDHTIIHWQWKLTFNRLHLCLGFVHPLQDVALHQCLPLSSVCCFPNPGGSLLICYVILPSSAWSSSWSLPSPWLSSIVRK